MYSTVTADWTGVDKGVYTFPKGISLTVMVIAQLEFELAYCDVTIQHVSLYEMGTSLLELNQYKSILNHLI